MTHFTIPMSSVDANRMGYGIRAKSRFVYDTTKSHYPTRVELWDNTGRPNDGTRKGYITGTGRWVDPQNHATDDMLTILISTESIGISSTPSLTTGHEGSGQVYAKQLAKMRDGDTATLVYDANGFGDVQVTLHFPPHHNGHGYATFGLPVADELVAD